MSYGYDLTEGIVRESRNIVQKALNLFSYKYIR